jgi:hypothetical protein
MPQPFRPLRSADWYRQHYAVHGSHEIAKILGCSASKVIKDLRHHQIDVDPQSPWGDLKRDYFNSIDTPNKSYLVGFIAADGTVSRSTCQLRVRLAEQDRSFLELVRRELGGAPLRTEQQPAGRQPTAVLCISSKQIVNARVTLGIIENKDNVLGPIAVIEPPLDRHFVRGLVDGDGTLKFVKGKFPRIEFKNRNDHLRRAVRRYWESQGATVIETTGRKVSGCLLQLLRLGRGGARHVSVGHRTGVATQDRTGTPVPAVSPAVQSAFATRAALAR